LVLPIAPTIKSKWNDFEGNFGTEPIMACDFQRLGSCIIWPIGAGRERSFLGYSREQGVAAQLTPVPGFATLELAAYLTEVVGCNARAEVAELADAHGSGPCTRKGVEVQVLSSAPTLSE
jgi:hypothetical protein